jgi:hypothetical protein
MVEPEGLVTSISPESITHRIKFCDVSATSVDLIVSNIPSSRNSLRASSLAFRSSSSRGISWLRLCHAEKLDRLVFTILVVYANSSSTKLFPFNDGLSSFSTTIRRYPQPWKLRLSRTSM